MNGYKNQRTVYEIEWVNILINQVYEWVYFFNDQVYDWVEIWATHPYHNYPLVTPPPPPRNKVYVRSFVRKILSFDLQQQASLFTAFAVVAPHLGKRLNILSVIEIAYISLPLCNDVKNGDADTRTKLQPLSLEFVV